MLDLRSLLSTTRRCGLLGLVVALLVAGVLSAAAAAAPYEPNDTFGAANGPLIGGQAYQGAIETTNDVDWFFFNVAAERQLDVALTSTTPDCYVSMALYDVDGDYISNESVQSSFSSGVQKTAHLTYSAGQSQYALKITANQGCGYTFTPTPADAYTSTSRGLQFTIGAQDTDSIYRLIVDGQTIANDSRGGTFVLGHLAPTSRITFEEQNTTDPYFGWKASLTDLEGRGVTTLWSENQSGGNSSSAPRIGIVRHVVLSPAGNILEGCGEALAAATCFPRDSDGDGFTDDVDACVSDRGVASARGCPDGDGDGIPDAADRCSGTAGAASAAGCPDRDGDGFADDSDSCRTIPGIAPNGCPAKQRYATLVTVRRSGRRISGRVSSSGPGCAGTRKVVLRRMGSGTRSFGATTARSNGTFTIVAPRRLRGRIYVVIAERSLKTKLCRAANSRHV